jgi:hypothetical protein
MDQNDVSELTVQTGDITYIYYHFHIRAPESKGVRPSGMNYT